MASLGVLTIGQAPRTDVQPIIEAHLTKNTDLIQKGALDGLSKERIKELAPSNALHSDYILTSRLKNGDHVAMDRRKLQPLVQKRINDFEQENVNHILLLCTGVFPQLTTKTAQIIEPDHVLPQVIKLMLGNKRLGVIVPLAEQVANIDHKFSDVDLDPLLTHASPYEKNKDDFIKAAMVLKDQVDLIVMDCMGYNEEMRSWVAHYTHLPVLLSNALMAKIISEFI
ncbi:AroM family protein [Sporolactobacillus kofuensis]|uniref:AroM family protein n=1 Tax=Sporolactobacillus kofuensis TaxID=269672 RepID=A0ABW1WCC1_9BACL|nr:AroM family protein [Sporolactobacillus kofuensis]